MARRSCGQRATHDNRSGMVPPWRSSNCTAWTSDRLSGGGSSSTCYDQAHRAPAPGCRCGLYAAIEGTLDSLSGYLIDSAHDRDPPVYAEVACTGNVFVDMRGARAERIEVLRLATSPSAWRDSAEHAEAVAELAGRYGIDVCDLDVVPSWVLTNAKPRGAPPDGATIDLGALRLPRCPSTTSDTRRHGRR
jgi:hypothetical protein